ncbi:hypothetical protein BDV40DRAFT_43377 [Aspergillus tamarii]|uniref:Uncharacterized protein n=1 Tax=Aspergillus tamarii TaxID=41984 RepID=A0A5N6UHI8_ASPTM|nr:hypothetical protein BDV40DRAFT_43377 [Aspergillus tamarii]
MQRLVCVRCGRIQPNSAGKYHACCNGQLYVKHCTADYCVAEYFSALRKSELWHSVPAVLHLFCRDYCLANISRKSQLETRCQIKAQVELRNLIMKVGDNFHKVPGEVPIPSRGGRAA